MRERLPQVAGEVDKEGHAEQDVERGEELSPVRLGREGAVADRRHQRVAEVFRNVFREVDRCTTATSNFSSSIP